MEKRAFTIIEILVVIVVIGVIAGASIPAFREFFVKTQFQESKQEITLFYQRTLNYSSTEGVDYKMELEKSNDFIRSMKDAAFTKTRDSIGVGKKMDLLFSGPQSITFTINIDGTVDADDGIRNFRLVDNETGDTAKYYISPLGVMEVR